MTRPIDPMRRTLPYAEWPAMDRRLWGLAVMAGNPLDEEGPAAH